MPIVYKKTKNQNLCIGIWEVVESESYFLENLTLSKNDQILLDNAKNSQRRIEILSVRLLIKNLGLNIDVTHTATGKPITQKGNISISHCKRYSAVIYHEHKTVSVDVEKKSVILLNSKHIVFNKKEIEFAKNNLERLTTIWCCKECVVKMTNNLTVNFLSQINVKPFLNGGTIKCDYIETKRIMHYKFHHFCINDHIIVWGVDNG